MGSNVRSNGAAGVRAFVGATLRAPGSRRLALWAFVAVGTFVLGGCQSSRSKGCGPCAPEPAPCAAPCATPCANPCATPCDGPPPVVGSARAWSAPGAGPCNAPCVTSSRPPTGDAECGEVWCLVHTPEVEVTETRERLVKPETCYEGFVPAQHTRIQEYAKVKEARLHYVKVPAQYECRTETYLICPSKSEWVCRCSEDACGHPKERWELCATPAKLGTRTKKVLVRPETVQPVWECAEYADVTRCVQTRPAHEPCYWCPPKFKTCTTTKVVCPESCEWRRTPECEVPAPVR